MNKPQYTRTLTGHSFFWADIAIKISMERVDQDGKGEFWCWHSNGDSDKLLHLGNHNLLSTTSTKQLAERLGKNNAEIDWNTVLTYVSAITLTENRKGNPLQELGGKPSYPKIDYQLRPILEKHQPTTLYAPGSTGKSYLADLMAVAVQYNIAVLDWTPEAGNVLYLDQEASHADHVRRIWAIRRGLTKKGGITDDEEKIQYRFCTLPLVSDITAIQQIVFDKHIALVIIDSMMAFEEGMPDAAQRASRFYNALRSLECTTLVIDHVSKQDWKGSENDQNSTGAYGSVVKYNRSRSIFELKKSQTEGDDKIELALIHRKHNEGRLLKTIGLRIKFDNDDNDIVQSVTFEHCDLSENPALSKNLGATDRIVELLKKTGKRSVNEIAEDTNLDERQVRARLSEKKGKFFGKTDGTNGEDDKWFLLAYT